MTEPNGVPHTSSGAAEDFIDQIVEFPDGSRYERLEPLTDLRKDPGEGRILYICRRIDESPSAAESRRSFGEKLVLKVKAQWPGPQQIFHAGPSELTEAELRALQMFGNKKVAGVPHLITWKRAIQPENGIHPGGYIIYTIMTRIPGGTLWDLGYWGMENTARSEIQGAFMQKLRELRELNVTPYDCALRNVMWDRESKRLGIVDFEHYHEANESIDNETVELQRWGLARRPPPRTWFQEWGIPGI